MCTNEPLPAPILPRSFPLRPIPPSFLPSPPHSSLVPSLPLPSLPPYLGGGVLAQVRGHPPQYGAHAAAQVLEGLALVHAAVQKSLCGGVRDGARACEELVGVGEALRQGGLGQRGRAWGGRELAWGGWGRVGGAEPVDGVGWGGGMQVQERATCTWVAAAADIPIKTHLHCRAPHQHHSAFPHPVPPPLPPIPPEPLCHPAPPARSHTWMSEWCSVPLTALSLLPPPPARSSSTARRAHSWLAVTRVPARFFRAFF